MYIANPSIRRAFSRMETFGYSWTYDEFDLQEKWKLEKLNGWCVDAVSFIQTTV